MDSKTVENKKKLHESNKIKRPRAFEISMVPGLSSFFFNSLDRP